MRRVFSCLVVAIGILGAAGAMPAAAAAAPPVLDGVQLRYLPAGLGGSTDFAYEYDGVDFASRVWESGSVQTGWQVDLKVDVMRGGRLPTGRALHDWFIAYEERPAGEARYLPVRVRDRPGWAARDEVFWLLRPGVAVSVRVDGSRWGRAEVLHIARGVVERPLELMTGSGTRSSLTS
jgi:hypothetical protein